MIWKILTLVFATTSFALFVLLFRQYLEQKRTYEPLARPRLVLAAGVWDFADRCVGSDHTCSPIEYKRSSSRLLFLPSVRIHFGFDRKRGAFGWSMVYGSQSTRSRVSRDRVALGFMDCSSRCCRNVHAALLYREAISRTHVGSLQR